MPCRVLKFSTAQCVTQHRALKAVTSHSIRVHKSNIKIFDRFLESVTLACLWYLEAYSRRENLKFEGIPELPESSSQQNATSKEVTKEVLVNFMENVLEIEDAKDMEFQRVHRIDKPKSENGNGSRTIIAHFPRFSDRERVFKCGRKLKDTGYKM